jgi:hypothetical protein
MGGARYAIVPTLNDVQRNTIKMNTGASWHSGMGAGISSLTPFTWNIEPDPFYPFEFDRVPGLHVENWLRS